MNQSLKLDGEKGRDWRKCQVANGLTSGDGGIVFAN